MEDFNAAQARKIVSENRKPEGELQHILELIKNNAEEGRENFHYYYTISSKTIEDLKEKGFKVEIDPHNQDPQYALISW